MTTVQFTAEPGVQIITLVRLFDARPERLFSLYTDPAQMPRWWGPADLATTVEQMDVRPGGIWRVIQRDPQGNVFAFHGVYHEVRPPHRLVFTFEFEGAPGHVLLDTVTFEDVGGKTRLTDQSVFQSVADRDGMLSQGMESGAVETLERLAALLQEG